MKDVGRLHSFNVCNLILQVDSVAEDTIAEQSRLMTLIKELEASKVSIMESGKVKLTALLGEKERLID
jgi:hypothetical protein